MRFYRYSEWNYDECEYEVFFSSKKNISEEEWDKLCHEARYPRITYTMRNGKTRSRIGRQATNEEFEKKMVEQGFKIIEVIG